MSPGVDVGGQATGGTLVSTCWSFQQYSVLHFSFVQVPVGREASRPGLACPGCADFVFGVSRGCPPTREQL